MKVALVHDDLTQFGGAEKLVLALHEIWPEAPIYTAVASTEWLGWAEKAGLEVRTSFLQKLPNSNFASKVYAFFLLYYLGFEAFDFSDYDVVISSTARFGHCIITGPKTIHISYVNSPNRYIWEQEALSGELKGIKKLLKHVVKIPFSYMRAYDYVAFQRPDYLISNSQNIRQKLLKFYRRDSAVIYPCFEKLQTPEIKEEKDTYYLVLSRIVGWKRIDLALEACQKLGRKLVVAGEGPDLQELKKKYPSADFKGYVTEAEKATLIAGAKALIMPQKEDFGITALEALSLGKPVVGFSNSGVSEIVKDGVTGVLFDSQSVESISNALTEVEKLIFDPNLLKESVSGFEKNNFKDKMKAYVESVYVSRT